MHKLNIDRFWVGMGLAAGCLVLLWSLGLAPKFIRRSKLQAELASRARALELAKEATPSRADIESWNKYRSELLQSRLQISKYYVENSKTFLSWFPDVPKGPDGDPAREAFVARYRDEAAKLEKRLSGVAVGDVEGDRAPGFNWEDLGVDRW